MVEKLKRLRRVTFFGGVHVLLLIVVFLSIEFYLQPAKLGVTGKSSSKLELIKALRSEGRKTCPSVGAPLLPHADFMSAHGILPLGGISDCTTVFCNEAGFWAVYESDQFGFSNENSDLGEKIDAILIGDSFAHGACVEPQDDIASQLSDFGLHTINFGQQGSGPLTELAILREYGALHSPAWVIWLYWVDDLFQLGQELQSPILRRYLDPAFSQDLPLKQATIDQVLTDYVNKLETDHNQQISWDTRLLSKLSTLKLSHTRHLIAGRLNASDDSPNAITPQTEKRISAPASLEQILQDAKAIANSWGGRLLVVNLPSYARNAENNPELDSIGKRLDVAVLDPLSEFKDEGGQPRPEFFARGDVGNHYSELGYAEVARAINKEIKKLEQETH